MPKVEWKWYSDVIFVIFDAGNTSPVKEWTVPMSEALRSLLALTAAEGIGDMYAKKLLRHFGSAEAVMQASEKELRRVEGIDSARVRGLKAPVDAARIDAELEFIAKNNIRVSSILDSSYPQRLLDNADAPPLLYSKGNVDANMSKVLAVVGSRKNTAIGKQFTEELVAGLAPYKPCIVSGLAYGIDIAAHKAALEAGLSTIGVLAHGLDRIYPAAHREVALRMQDQGGLMTEYMSGTNPDRQNFPSRNRIVAGMCDGIIVVETAQKGGAMITAKLALSYNRQVFALPGRYNDPRSEGCNYLIKTNIAGLITSAEDVAEELGWNRGEQKQPMTVQPKLFDTLSGEEQVLYDIISEKEGIHIDELLIKTGMENAALASLLLQLEFANAISSMPGKRYRAV